MASAPDLQHALLDLETRFYLAFERGDVALMMTLWHPDHPISCIHPGGPRLTGLKAIEEAWRLILPEMKGVVARFDEVVQWPARLPAPNLAPKSTQADFGMIGGKERVNATESPGEPRDLRSPTELTSQASVQEVSTHVRPPETLNDLLVARAGRERFYVDGDLRGVLLATNLYQWSAVECRWYVVEHHASPDARPTDAPAGSSRLQ
ncbi:MAG: YybH family protein [Thioalkalivibrionaceae bacterium]